MRTRLLPALLGTLVTGLILASIASATAPANTAAPAVTGSATVGGTLTVSNGTWSNSPTGYSYQWQRCSSATTCTDINNAVGQSYVVRNADGGYRIRAEVRARNADGSSTADSNLTDVIAATGAPVSTARPTVSGDAIVGHTLTVDNGTWSAAPTSFRYQWIQCDRFGAGCVGIPGATGKTYDVRFADVSGTLRVVVTARNAKGSASRISTQSDVVQPVPVVHVAGNKAPTITFLSLKRLGIRVYARFRV